MRVTLVFLLAVGGVLSAPKVFEDTNANAPQSRIFGGKEAVANSRPYIVYLTYFKYSDGTSWHCGGTLISQNYVLTSANCSLNANYAEVILGVHDIYKAETTEIIAQATNMTLHPDFNSETYANDIALLRLSQPITYSDAVQPATLPTVASSSYEGTIAFISGWGLTSTGKISEVLNEVEVKVVSNTECKTSLSNIDDNELCTSGTDGAVPCSQDFGGPLIIKGTSTIIGIMSFTGGTCKADSPAVYTKVASYLDWIKANSDV